MKIRSVVAGALLAVSIGSASAAPALADSSPQDVINTVLNSDNPKAAYEALSANERAVFDSRMLPSEVEVEFTVPPGTQATGCFQGEAKGSGKAVAGNTLYTYWVDGVWCMNSVGTVTSATFTSADGETSTPGWRYDGVKSHGAGFIPGVNVALIFAHHLFILGAGGIDIQHSDVCIRLIGISNGQASADSKCSSTVV